MAEPESEPEPQPLELSCVNAPSMSKRSYLFVWRILCSMYWIGVINRGYEVRGKKVPTTGSGEACAANGFSFYAE